MDFIVNMLVDANETKKSDIFEWMDILLCGLGDILEVLDLF